jgi:hypothetical protein
MSPSFFKGEVRAVLFFALSTAGFSRIMGLLRGSTVSTFAWDTTFEGELDELKNSP